MSNLHREGRSTIINSPIIINARRALAPSKEGQAVESFLGSFPFRLVPPWHPRRSRNDAVPLSEYLGLFKVCDVS
jgi:hypothetical protein